MKHIHLDLETLSTEANAVILSIGACWFDPQGDGFLHSWPDNPHPDGPEEKFYPFCLTPLNFEAKIDIQSCLDVGMAVSGSTLTWWSQQSDEARKRAFGGTTTIREALNDFAEFVAMVRTDFPNRAEPDDVCIWGNGAAFDNAVLTNAYHRLGYQTPWSFRNDRCYRTFVAMMKDAGIDPEFKRLGVFHDALSDAISQAMHIQRINAARVPAGFMKEAA